MPLLILVLAGAFLVRIPGIKEMPLRVDEQATLRVAGLSLMEILDVSYTAQPPLFPLLGRFALVFGADWLVRLPALLGGVILVAAVFAGASMLGFRSVAPLAAAIGASSVYLVYYSQEARGYSLMSALMGISSFTALYYLKKPRFVWLLGAVLSGLAGCAAHYFAVPTFLVLIAVLVTHTGILLFGGALEIRRALASLALLLVPISIFLYVSYDQVSRLYGIYAEGRSTRLCVGPTFGAEVCGRWLGLGGGAGALVAGVAVFGGLVVTRRSKHNSVLILILLVPFLFFAIVPWSHRFEMRYLGASVAPFLVLFSVGFWHLLCFVGLVARRITSARAIEPITVVAGAGALLALQLSATASHGMSPRKYLPFTWTNSFGHRYIVYGSLLNPEMVESRHATDFQTRPRSVEGLVLPLPDWPRVSLIGATTNVLLRNSKADDTLRIIVNRRAGVPPEIREPRSGGSSSWTASIRKFESAYSGKRIACTMLVAYNELEDLYLRIVINSPRLELVDSYLHRMSLLFQSVPLARSDVPGEDRD